MARVRSAFVALWECFVLGVLLLTTLIVGHYDEADATRGDGEDDEP